MNREPAVGSRFGWTDAMLLLTATIWGINFSVVKAALAYLPPLAFNAIRFFVAAVALAVLVRAAGYPLRFARRDLPLLIGLGLLGNSLYQVLFVYGAALTTADNASLMLSTAPAWVALFGTAAGTDHLAVRGWLGIGLALAGVATIVLAGGHETAFRFGGASLRGDLLVLTATLCWCFRSRWSPPGWRSGRPSARFRSSAFCWRSQALPWLAVTYGRSTARRRAERPPWGRTPRPKETGRKSGSCALRRIVVF